MSEDAKEQAAINRLARWAEEPGIGMNNAGELNIVGFDPAYVDHCAGSSISRVFNEHVRELHQQVLWATEIAKRLQIGRASVYRALAA